MILLRPKLIVLWIIFHIQYCFFDLYGFELTRQFYQAQLNVKQSGVKALDEDMDHHKPVTSSGNQSLQNKSRSLLSRTLALVLNPLSGVAYSVSVHDLSCEKIGKLFEDFKRCNKRGINVLLTDAVDDIDLVGWISPFTLLIHGSAEDISTIIQAWIGRMLKPPEGFVIKDFGEISTVNMQQIPQSQFISICETLYQIIASLNENNVNATFECVMNRLSNCFESVVIPPLPAVGKSLDLLVKEKKLDIIGGSYFARNTQGSHIQRTTIVNHNSPIGLESGGARVKKNQINKRNPVSKARKTTSDMEEPKVKRNIKILNVKEGIQRKRNSKKAFNEWRNENKRNKKMKKKGCDRQLGKPSYTSPERNDVTDNEFFDGISHKETIVNLETEDLHTNNKKEKRLSFLARFSRLFKKTSCEENELSSEACESGSENRLNEYHIDDELVKLVPDLDRTRKTNKELRKKKEKSDCDKKGNIQNQRKVNRNNPKRVDKVNHKFDTPTKRRTTSTEVNSVNRHSKISQNGAKQNTNFKTTRFTLNLPSSASSYSSYECARKDLEYDRKNGTLKKSVRNEPRRFIYHAAQDIDSSWSETSSFSNGHSSEYSSDTCCELTRTPLHYSPAINDEDIKPNGAEHVLNFASTQAICGDLELSTPSLIPTTVVDVKQTAEHMTSTSMSPVINDLERQSPDKSELQTKNMFQLIGIL